MRRKYVIFARVGSLDAPRCEYKRKRRANMVTVGWLIRLEAKPGQEADVERSLKAGLARIREEPEPIAWIAIRLGPSTFGIFEAYSDEEARQTLLAVGSALLAKKASLFARPPLIEKVDILAAKLPEERPRAEDNTSS
jgi:quinol monooxygenase YgiN